MFNIAVKLGSGNSVTVKQPCEAETLTDAEGYAKAMLDMLFPDKHYILVYRDDLEYEVYFVNEPEAFVTITQG